MPKSSFKRLSNARSATAGGGATGKTARNRELARIHILKAQLKLDDESYRNVLWVQGRVDSAADLDQHGRQAVIKHLESHLPPVARRPRRIEGTPPRTLASRPMLRKIAAQLGAADRPWAYGEALAARLAGKQALVFCSDADLRKIIAALAIDAGRRAS